MKRMDMERYEIQGFRASAVQAGIKKKDRLDLGLIFSETEAVVAGVFTTCKVKAAPVILAQEHMRSGKGRAIVANSGNANACTGKEGLEKARRTAELAAEELGILPEEVLVASTGVIGAPLNMDAIEAAIPDLVRALSPEGLPRVEEAIMTTDSFPKMASFDGLAGGMPYRIMGICKGAGMIMPDMATMLCFVLTDVRINAPMLRKALREAVEPTFNRITVDGDTSTNDTVMVMANGLAGNGPMGPEDRETFTNGLTHVLGELATMVVRDGEGATKLIRLSIKGAATARDAEKAARVIAKSALVKTAFYGADCNWGRIMAALGRSGIAMKEEAVDIWVGEAKIVEGGLGCGPGPEKKATELMKGKEFSVTVDLRQGPFEDHILTCDLTHEYVSINADYRT
jgi:glutamate N-acetyltransferase/amino-acid N-acetyltransferase